MTDETELKQTQGNKKINQMIGDLKRNAYFLRSLNKLEKYFAQESYSDIKRDDDFEGKITDRMMEINEEIKSLAQYYKRNKSKIEKLIELLTARYAIDPDLIIDLSVSKMYQQEILKIGEPYDMCRVVDLYDRINNPRLGDPPIELDSQFQKGLDLFPIHLEIHRLASKRDVLDFVEKRWNSIESLIGSHRNKKHIVRQRKLPVEISDLIWENRNSGHKEIKRLLDIKFPKNIIVYNEINSIINQERKRRLGKISVGR